MKEYDIVRLLVDREKYSKAGILKGSVGIFSEFGTVFFSGKAFQDADDVWGFSDIELKVKEEDLEKLDNFPANYDCDMFRCDPKK